MAIVLTDELATSLQLQISDADMAQHELNLLEQGRHTIYRVR
jgi:hypothetical protein